MGWWSQTADGDSLQLENTGLYWGDGPADFIDNAIHRWRRRQPDLTAEQFEQMAMLSFYAKRGDIVAAIARPGEVDAAINDIWADFLDAWDRPPNETEMRAGIRFSTAIWEDDD